MQCRQISGVFQFATRQAAETESLFTAVERVLHYIRNVPKEPVYSKDARHNEAEASSKCCGKRAAPIEWHGSELMLPEWKKENWDQNLQSSWPGKGTIEFKRVVARYRPDLEPALRNLSLKLPVRRGMCTVNLPDLGCNAGMDVSFAFLFVS